MYLVKNVDMLDGTPVIDIKPYIHILKVHIKVIEKVIEVLP
ncbi:MAG: TrmO family methyltransferase [Actinomycetota bacterium]|nr:TrmO family methyltransferase [Actinomycetota bacterium]MDD5601177.1 TrmO family methyltransferase [Actinomycetota bacterium]